MMHLPRDDIVHNITTPAGVAGVAWHRSQPPWLALVWSVGGLVLHMCVVCLDGFGVCGAGIT